MRTLLGNHLHPDLFLLFVAFYYMQTSRYVCHQKLRPLTPPWAVTAADRIAGSVSGCVLQLHFASDSLQFLFSKLRKLPLEICLHFRVSAWCWTLKKPECLCFHASVLLKQRSVMCGFSVISYLIVSVKNVQKVNELNPQCGANRHRNLW